MTALENEHGKIGWILLWALGVPITSIGYFVYDPRLHVRTATISSM
jgi:hypothetical protein